ncbi:DUF72 domain-containing protein [Kineosporia mesophila]|nr:DUF72 domain-containing protein [Kineosporia mesophila]MCD5349863.1 DUF72 domain-containing protein [Kineosporia mesophila]
MQRLHVGCAMWTHKAWSGRVTPRGAGAQERLRFYANWCNAVEGNTTFYATPTRETVETWARQTDPDFRFVLKLPKVITHERRFVGVDEELRQFLHVVEPLGPRIQALWIQLPGTFAPTDVPTLEGLLRKLPPENRYAVEVRHPQFFSDPGELERVCERTGTEWVPFDTTAFFASPPSSDAEREAWERKPRLPRRDRALTERPVIRYLGRDDEARTVAGWQHWVEVMATWLREGRSPTFFLHTPDNVDAPALARRFHDEVRARVPGLEPLPTPEPVEPATLF